MLYTPGTAETKITSIDRVTFGGEETGLFDNIKYSYKLDRARERIDSPSLVRNDILEEYLQSISALPNHTNAIAEIRSRISQTIPSPMGDIAFDPMSDAMSAFTEIQAPDVELIGDAREHQNETYYTKFYDEVRKYVESNPDVREAVGDLTEEVLQQKASEKVQQLYLDQQDAYRRSTGAGVAGSFIGSMGALATDPVTIGAMVATRNPASGWFRNALRESVAAAVSEGVIQKTTTEDWYKELGFEYTQEDFINRVMFAGGAGFVLGGGAEFISGKLRKSLEKLEQQRAEVSGRPIDPNADYEVMFNLFDIHAMVKQESPMEFDPGNMLHTQKEQRAYNALMSGDFSGLVNNDLYVPRRYNNLYHYDVRQPNTELVDLDTLLVDTKRFQAKAQPTKLEAQAWDPVKAGTALVYEFKDGSRYVVDAHGRVEFGKTIQAQTGQKIQMPAIVLKENMGVTPDQALARGLGKNLAEGTITETDIKNLFKRYNQEYRPIPTEGSQIVRQINELSSLSRESYEMIRRGDVTEEQGAIVGRLIADPALQKAAMKSLMLLEPKTLAEAEGIVRQVREKGLTTTVKQMDEAFGETSLAIDLYKERATLLDQAMPTILDNNKMFDQLLRKLNLENLGREERYGKIAQIIYGNANTKGYLSDALTRAASAYAKAGKNADQYAREFAEDVLRNVDQRDFIRLPDGSQLVSDATQTQRFAATRELEVELQKYDDTTDLQGQKEAIQAAEARIRADEKLLNQKLEVDMISESGKISTETFTLKDLLDEVREEEVGQKLLKACSIGTK